MLAWVVIYRRLYCQASPFALPRHVTKNRHRNSFISHTYKTVTLVTPLESALTQNAGFQRVMSYRGRNALRL
jgi:hypothetical protein